MSEEDVKRAELIQGEIQSFVCRIFMQRGELHKLEDEIRRNKQSDIPTQAEARYKRLKTPTTDNSSEDGTTGSSEKETM